MKSAVLYGPSDVRIEELDIPRVADDEVLVKVDTALTCGTDVKVFLRGGHPMMIIPPAPFGHEFAGEIEEAGRSVRGFPRGMRVVSANSAPCGACFYCKRSKENLCEDLLFINGAYSEYVRIPARVVQKNLLPVPENVGCEEAALTEPLACVLNGLEETSLSQGETVLISGSGPIGLLFAQTAKLKGARVIVSDPDENRRAMAARAGADFVLDPGGCDMPGEVRRLTGGRGADAGIEAAGVPSAWESTARTVRKGGRVTFFGGCAPGTLFKLDTGLVHYGELTFRGVFHHTPFFIEKALEIISRRLIDPSCVVTGRMPLRELGRAFEMMISRSSAKIAISMEP